MICCEGEPINLGCQNYCEPIPTGFNAIQDGIHTFTMYFVNGTGVGISQDFTIGEELEIPAGTLNEAKNYRLFIIQPDGMRYDFGGTECLELTTLIIDSVLIE